MPPELNNVVQKCLEKNKDKRYQTLKEFYADLIQVIKKYKYTIRMRSGEFQPAGLTEKKSNIIPILVCNRCLDCGISDYCPIDFYA